MAHYVALLRTDEFCASKPYYEIVDNGLDYGQLRFQANLKLPANSSLTVVAGPSARSKKAAKRLAAFEAVRQLRDCGELNEHLAPKPGPKVFPDQTAALHYNLKGIGKVVDGVTPKNMHSFQPKLPPVFDAPGILEHGDKPTEVYYTTLRFPGKDDAGNAFQPLALVTRTPLPSDRLAKVVFANCHDQSICELPQLAPARRLELDGQQLRRARTYTLSLLALISSRLFEEAAMPYLLLPMDKDVNDIDWRSIEETSEREIRKVPLQPEVDWAENRLLLDHSRVGSGARAFRAVKVDTAKTPLDVKLGSEDKDGTAMTYWDEAIARKARQETHSAPNELTLQEGQPLLETTRLTQRLDNFLIPLQRRNKASSKEIHYLIPQLTLQHSIGASVFESARMVPSYLAGLEHALNARDLNERMFEGRLDPTSTVTALTAPGAFRPFNNQRLEFLGDVFLKAISCAYVFALSDARTEGFLHLDARAILANSSLVEKTKDFELGTLLCTKSFTRRNWCPPLLEASNREPIDPDERLNHLSPKMIADIVESLIGAAVSTPRDAGDDALWLNVDLGLFACVKLGVLPAHIDSISAIARIWQDQVEPKAIAERWDERPHRERLDKLEAIWDYHFSMPHLALEALTHPGHLNSALPSYQRLEFLGDGLLDLFIDAWLFRRFPNFNEGKLTAFKGMLVSNKALSALCEATKLYKYLQTDFQPSLMRAVQAATTDLKLAREKVDGYLEKRQKEGGEVDGQRKPALHYWIGRSSLKALADIVEATLGAVFVDSGFSFEAAWKHFQRIYMPWYERYATSEAYEQRVLIEEEKRQEALAKRAAKIGRMEE